MSRNNYNKMINENMLICWTIMAIVLVISYMIEIFKGFISVQYVIVFSAVLFIPIVVTTLLNIHFKGINPKIRYSFALGFLLFYTFTMFTAQTFLVFVYLIPMVSVLLVYNDRKLIIGVFSYATLINLLSIIHTYVEFYTTNKVFVLDLEHMTTFFEIQIACIILSAVFLYKTTKLLKAKDDMIAGMEADIYTDALTGLKNIRFLEENIHKIFNLNANKNLSVGFIDIDDFKHFNTKYGHVFGDEVLKTTCSIIHIEAERHKKTYAIRVGGDEFVVISRTLNNEEFVEVMNNIRKQIEETKLKYHNKFVGICISVGIANKIVDECDDFYDLYNLADTRNAEAKRKGKNIIVSKKSNSK